MKRFHEFTIIASGLDPSAEDFEDRFFKAGCSDATISLQKGSVIVEFSREAQTFSSALISACADVLRTGAKIDRIEPDHLVSLSDIAKRSGLSRAAISLYTTGSRSTGFPTPVARVTSESPLWDWVDVSRWMYHQQKVTQETVLEARMVREANIVTQAHALPHDHFVKRLEERMSQLETA